MAGLIVSVTIEFIVNPLSNFPGKRLVAFLEGLETGYDIEELAGD